jgi:hypothetical protein
MTPFQELLDRYAFHAYEKQNRLLSLVGEHEWLLDTERGIVTFNSKIEFAAHFLGTESEITNIWLWADANRKVTFPVHALQMCKAIREEGRKRQITEFAQDHFEFIDEVGRPNGHTLAMVATWLGNASCYYRGPHEHGAVFFALKDKRIDAQPDLDHQGFHDAFNNLMWQPGDMKTRIISYLCDKGCLPAGFDGDDVRCRLPNGEKIWVQFKTGPNGSMTVTLRE